MCTWGAQSRLFIDEVQLREGFEKASSSIRTRGGWDVYLTEFELEMREEPEKWLWLTANWHKVRDDWRADATADGIPAARRSRGWHFMLASEAQLGRARHVLLGGYEAFAGVRGYLCDSDAIGACYREHVGPPSKPPRSQTRDLQRALGRAEVPGVPDELGRLFAQEKEEGADEGARKVK